jgi:hypothetical protein
MPPMFQLPRVCGALSRLLRRDCCFASNATPCLRAGCGEILTRTNALPTRAQEMLRFPLALRIDAKGVVRGETTYVENGQRLRVMLQRVDITSVARPW